MKNIEYNDNNQDNNQNKPKFYEKYLYAGLSMFGVIAASIILTFVLLNLDQIGKVLSHIAATLMPFIIGAVLAYIICPLCNNIEKLLLKMLQKMENSELKEKLSRTISVFLGLVVTFIMFYLMLMIIIPQLITSIIRIAQLMPGSVDRLINWLQEIFDSNELLLAYSETIIDKAYTFIQNWISNGLLETVENIASGFSSGVFNAFSIVMNICIGVIIAVYMLLSRKKLARQANMIVYSIFKKKYADVILDEIHYIDRVFSGFINGKILDAVIVAVICYIGMMIFKFLTPGSTTLNEILIAVIVGIFNVVPFFGWYIGLFLSAALALMVNPVQCIFFIIFDVILQQIDGNILGPKIIGNTTGISSFWVLFSIFLFGDIWGFAGMLFGVPIFAVIYHGIKRLVFRGLHKRGQSQMVADYERDYPEKEDEDTDKNVLN